MSHVPGWWQFVLLAAAAYRIFRLLAFDTITERWRERLLEKIDREADDPKWRTFVTCPWCAGFWITVAWWLAWLQWPHATLVAATPFAISLAVGLTATRLDP